MEEKEQLKIYLPARLLKDFRMLVAQKHGIHKRGLLSFEVEVALKQYMATFLSTHAVTQNSPAEMKASLSNPFPKVYKLKNEIKQWLQTTGMYFEGVPQFIPERHLVSAISALKGADHRTINKWTSVLIQCGCIKRSGPHQYEFV